MNKRGVSPLVATLLLIAFAIALGLVVMNWGKSYIEEKAEFTSGADVSSCGLAELSIIKVSGKDKVCYNPADNSIQVFLESGTEIRIKDIKVSVLGSSGIHNVESILTQPLERATGAQIKFNYPASIGAIEQVKLTPIIGDEEPVLCGHRAVVSENIGQC
jgi:flagellin-like protein